MPKNRTPPDRAAPPDRVAPPRRNTSWAARYGQAILRDGIAALPRALYYHQGELGLAAHEVWFVTVILACKWDEGLPRPRLPVLAAGAGLSVRQLQKTRKELEVRDLLRVVACYDADGRQNANSYDFEGLFARLEELIAASPADDNAILDVVPPGHTDDPDPDTSFVARYGRVIARAGIAAVPQALFTYQATLGLSPQQVWFVSYILAHRWSADVPYPSLRRMVIRTGYSERQLHTIKQELVDRGYLRLITRYGAGGGQDTNGYDFSLLLEAITAHLQRSAPGERVNSATGGGVNSTSGEQVNSATGGGVNSISGEWVNSTTEGSELDRRAPDEQNHRGEGVLRFRRKETDHQEADQGDSKDLLGNQPGTNPQKSIPHSPYIAAVILDYSRELGDTSHGPPNVSQALRLWHESQIGETAFVEILHEARRRVRLYQGKQGLGQITNKMAYFFTVAHDLMEAVPRPDNERSSAPS